MPILVLHPERKFLQAIRAVWVANLVLVLRARLMLRAGGWRSKQRLDLEHVLLVIQSLEQVVEHPANEHKQVTTLVVRLVGRH